MFTHYTQDLREASLSDKISYHKFSQSPEAAGLGFINVRSLWNICLVFRQHCSQDACQIENKYGNLNTNLETLWDHTIRRLIVYWNGTQLLTKQPSNYVCACSKLIYWMKCSICLVWLIVVLWEWLSEMNGQISSIESSLIYFTSCVCKATPNVVPFDDVIMITHFDLSLPYMPQSFHQWVLHYR